MIYCNRAFRVPGMWRSGSAVLWFLWVDTVGTRLHRFLMWWWCASPSKLNLLHWTRITPLVYTYHQATRGSPKSKTVRNVLGVCDIIVEHRRMVLSAQWDRRKYPTRPSEFWQKPVYSQVSHVTIRNLCTRDGHQTSTTGYTRTTRRWRGTGCCREPNSMGPARMPGWWWWWWWGMFAGVWFHENGLWRTNNCHCANICFDHQNMYTCGGHWWHIIGCIITMQRWCNTLRCQKNIGFVCMSDWLWWWSMLGGILSYENS